MYVELYLLSNVVLLHVKDTNPTTYFLDVELSAMLSYRHVELPSFYSIYITACVDQLAKAPDTQAAGGFEPH